MSELQHYGVLGMKWGIRRTPEQLGVNKPKKKRARDMSDDELRKANNRKQLENQYNQLYKGKSVVKTILATTGTVLSVYNTVKTIGKDYKETVDFLVEKVGNKIIDEFNDVARLIGRA